jgi:hypothetical protein
LCKACWMSKLSFLPAINKEFAEFLCWEVIVSSWSSSAEMIFPSHYWFAWQGPSTWRMMYAMDLNAIRNLALAADNFGFLYQ